MAYMLTWRETLLILLPALAANGAPVLLKYSGTAIDGGRYFIDGRRILGDGKTWEGFATGILYGSILALLLSALTCNLLLAYGGILVSLGAMLGSNLVV
jgi:CDP-2,3-bis-(O-geranylgeranyl)-sn-glycerol synthase